MQKHFPSWRTQDPIVLTICMFTFVAQYRLNGYQDQYRPTPPDKPFVGPARQIVTADVPATLPRLKRTQPTPSYLSRLLSLMAEDPTIVRGEMRMMMPGRLPTSFHHIDAQGNVVVTKVMPAHSHGRSP